MPGVFAKCPQPNCGAGQLHEPLEHGCVSHPNSAVCWKCLTQYCTQHTMPWHHGVTCAEAELIIDGPGPQHDAAEEHRMYSRLMQKMTRVLSPTVLQHLKNRRDDRAQARLSERLIAGLATRCPAAGCGLAIEKVGGCAVVRCTGCGTDFCWYCGGTLRGDFTFAHEAECSRPR